MTRRRRQWAPVFVVFIVLGAVATGGRASATPCQLGSGGLGCGDSKPGGPPAPPSGSQGSGSTGGGSATGGSGSGHSAGGSAGDCNCHYIREYIGITMVGTGGVSVPAPAPGFCTDQATGQQGVPYNDYRVDNATGQRTLIGSGCEVPGTPGPGQVPGEQGVAAAAPPPPPSPQQVWAETPLPPPSFTVNPTQGLTGLATYLWTTAPAAVNIALPPINGYSLSATAHPVAYRWTMGDGTTVVGAGPGSESSPSATHVYEWKSDYTITLEVVWAGTYTATYPGLPPQPLDLGTTARQGSQPYHVIEVRSVLDGTTQ